MFRFCDEMPYIVIDREVTEMKTYQKGLLGMILALFCCFSPVHALAAEPSLTITSGLAMEEEETECTFQDSRVVYGEATPYADILCTITQPNAAGELEEVYSDSLTVGSLGLFSTTLPLEMGYNHITIALTQTEDAEPEIVLETVVKRVSSDVKTQLQRMIALPGLPEIHG